jgi:hypothetical protein
MGDDETDPYYLVETTMATPSTTSNASTTSKAQVSESCLLFGVLMGMRWAIAE